MKFGKHIAIVGILATALAPVRGFAAEISGQVISRADGTPLHNIYASAYRQNGNSWQLMNGAYTDSAGNYTIKWLSAGTYRVQFTHWGGAYLQTHYTNALDLADATDVPVNSETSKVNGINVTMRTIPTFTGRVTGPDGETPLAGIQVTAYLRTGGGWQEKSCAFTDTYGEYSILWLDPGTYRVYFADWSGPYLNEYYNRADDLNSAQDIVFPRDEDVANINAALRYKPTISGRVTGPDGVTPLAGIYAAAFQWTGTAWQEISSCTTDAAGNYTIKWLGLGTYRVQFFEWSGKYLGECYPHADTLADAADIVMGTNTVYTGIDAALRPVRSISGRVTDRQNQAALSGIAVTAYKSAGASWQSVSNRLTDADGFYVFSNLVAGTYRVQFADPAGAHHGEYYCQAPDLAAANDIVLNATSAVRNVDAALRPLASISGRVKAAGNEAPVPGIRVVALRQCENCWHEASSGYSDEAGTYALSGLEAGAYRVAFEDPAGHFVGEYYDCSDDISEAQDVIVAQGAETTGVDAILEAASGVSGRITALASGEPLPNITVTLTLVGEWGPGFYQITSTDDNGEYEFQGVEAGTYRLEFRDNNLDYIGQFYDQQTDWFSATLIDVPESTLVTGLNAALVEGAKLSGTVTDTQGAPAPGINVSCERWTGSYWQWMTGTLSDDDGQYTLRGLPAGDYRVWFWDPNGQFISEYYDDQIDWNEATSVAVATATHVTGVDATLAKAGTISGTVTGQAGAPLADIAVTVYRQQGGQWWWQENAMTDENGHYTIGRLPGGLYHVYFTDWQNDYLPEYYNDATEYDDAEILMLPAEGALTGIDAELTKGATISGMLTGPDGQTPAGGVTVTAYMYTNHYWYWVGSSSSAQNGMFTIKSLRAGTYRLQFNDYNETYLAQVYAQGNTLDDGTDIPVATGEDVTGIDASLRLAARISGTVTAEDGVTPLANIAVIVGSRNGMGMNFQGNTDDNGQYTIRGLPAGSYIVQFVDYQNAYLREFYDDAQTRDAATEFTLASGDWLTGIDATLGPGSRLSGRVTAAATQSPVAGISVSALHWNGSWWDTWGSATTDDNGEYSLGGLMPGSYKVQFQDWSHTYLPEFYNQAWTMEQATVVQVSADEDVAEIDAALSVAAQLSGRVTSATTQQPLAGISVTAVLWINSSWGASQHATTDSNGEYTITGLMPGTYRVFFTDYTQTHSTEYYDNAPSIASATDIPVASQAHITGIDAALESASSIAGTVTALGGSPVLANISVQAFRWDGAKWAWAGWAETDAAGNYTFNGLAAGEYRLQFHDQSGNYAGACYSNVPSLDAANSIALAAGQQLTGINMHLGPAAWISGCVTGPDGSTPLRNIEVNVGRWTRHGWQLVNGTYTDQNGEYSLGGLRAGEYRVQFFDHEGVYATEYFNDKRLLDEAEDIVLAVAAHLPGLNASLAYAGSISGQVTAQDSGLPMPSLWVTAYTWTCEGWQEVAWTGTDENGAYTVGSLTPGTYRLGFRDPSETYATKFYNNAPSAESAGNITLTDYDHLTGYNVALERGASIAGRVTGSNGETPLAGIEVEAHYWTGNNWAPAARDFTAADGTYQIVNLLPGTYRVQFLDHSLTHAGQSYANAATLAEGTDITLAAGQQVNGIHAALQPLAKPEPPVMISIADCKSGNCRFTIMESVGRKYVLQGNTALDKEWGDLGEPFYCAPGTNSIVRGSSKTFLYWRIRAVQ